MTTRRTFAQTLIAAVASLALPWKKTKATEIKQDEVVLTESRLMNLHNVTPHCWVSVNYKLPEALSDSQYKLLWQLATGITGDTRPVFAQRPEWLGPEPKSSGFLMFRVTSPHLTLPNEKMCIGFYRCHDGKKWEWQSLGFFSYYKDQTVFWWMDDKQVFQTEEVIYWRDLPILPIHNV